jgi:glycosyltransferase involved in cell wall biosynthesis
LKQVDGVITLSEPVSEALMEWSPVTLFHPLYDHLPRGPRKDEARRQLGLGKEDVVHLFFGLIRPYKGLSVLLEALKELPENHKLVVAGECYGSWDPYAELIHQGGLESRVLVHNEFIDDDLVPIYFSAADTAVLPYTQASQSGVTAMALHHEVRVVASDVGDLANTVVPELTGRLVPPGDVQALAEAMVQPWNAQPADVKGAFEQVKKRLSWSAWASQLTQQVESALSEVR